MNIVIFEDFRVEQFAPLTSARPAFAISMAGTTLLDALRRLEPRAAISWIVREQMREIAEARHADNRPPAPLPKKSEPALFLNALAIPRLSALRGFLEKARRGESFCVGSRGDAEPRLATTFFPRLPFALEGEKRGKIEGQLLSGTFQDNENLNLPLLRLPHEMISAHATLLRENLEELVRLPPLDGEAPWSPLDGHPGVWARGKVSIHPSAVVEGDGDRGPILLDAGAEIGPLAYVRGPLFVGVETRIAEQAAVKGNTQIGKHCRVGGEVHSSVMEAFSNKAHHGFLGHSWVGSWVNLGAGTSNSNLKNTYGEIRVDYGGESVGTGVQFFGCLIGDFSKAAINTSIFTGKMVGPCSCLYGFVTANVPSFCNYARTFGQVAEFPLEAALIAQKRMFARRGVQQTEADRSLLRHLWENARKERSLPEERLSL
jgi:UDP-N-acetylglucosamine diphosphorylase/glucosamine-1-phosphate N-acetyltransferase